MKHRAAPRFCVWEITLRCNAACIHCGSSAGSPRPAELDSREALELCDDMAVLGVERVTLSGGEPLLRADWPDIAGRLRQWGILVDMISNGIALDAAAARFIASLGLRGVSLSIDGPEEVHDRLRGKAGAFRAALEAVGRLRSEGVPVGAVTQINRLNVDRLEELERLLAEAGVKGWQLQLTMPAGRCREHEDLPLGPAAVPAVIRFTLDAGERRRIPIIYAADNIGWMGSWEPVIRSTTQPPKNFYCGCQAGLSVVGIASNGDVRGCLSLPEAFNEGSVRRRKLQDIWNDGDAFGYNRKFREEDLSGWCASCALRRVCRGGCKCLAYTTTGGLSQNTYCARMIEGARSKT